MRVVVLFVAFWCAIFALMNVVQMAVLIAPPEKAIPLMKAWAVGALCYAPLAVWIFHQARKGPSQ